jgi:hypothetical protein
MQPTCKLADDLHFRQAFIEEKEKMEAKSNRAKSGESTRVVTFYVSEQNSY